ncbi:hypothetical protein NA57DRAFT_64217 [Rhizodiscina lignyota]|uniref:Uncharacterized protein n=1 Tax=Rhizodiscina lignyota TaxID=1504668 RepID=A0A9P4MD90_9PEZI|nr:hypothetical protein NA57DRAFT_64217 [Rhizodiscina lignyota]
MAPGAIYPEEYKVIDTTLNHYLDPEKGGHSSYYTGTAGYYRRKFDEHAVKIQNMRGREDQFDLNTQGFRFYRSPTVGGDFQDTEFVKREVYPETEELLKKVTGASRVVVFSHILRNNSRDAAEAKVKSDASLADDNAEVEDVTPARFIHIDQSEVGAREVLDDNIHPPELAAKLAKSRWSIINCWRPIKPVHKDPLAMCDARTAKDEDLIPIPVYFPPKDGPTQHRYATLTEGDRFELLYCKYNPEHEWYYVDGMKPGECLLIKCFDTIRDGKTARRVPHSAFTDPTNHDDTTRESVEIRCLVFYEDQPLEG